MWGNDGIASFLTALEQRLPATTVCHPITRHGLPASFTREDLREYAGDYYHHVAAFPRI